MFDSAIYGANLTALFDFFMSFRRVIHLVNCVVTGTTGRPLFVRQHGVALSCELELIIAFLQVMDLLNLHYQVLIEYIKLINIINR